MSSSPAKYRGRGSRRSCTALGSCPQPSARKSAMACICNRNLETVRRRHGVSVSVPAKWHSKLMKEQEIMPTGSYTHDEARVTDEEQRYAIAFNVTSLSSRAEAVGRELARYGLVVIVGWIGLMKFTAYEAEGIRLYVTNSPLMSWVYGYLSVRGCSAVLGVVEVAV